MTKLKVNDIKSASAKIKINNITPSGAESFISNLEDNELQLLGGGWRNVYDLIIT